MRTVKVTSILGTFALLAFLLYSDPLWAQTQSGSTDKLSASHIKQASVLTPPNDNAPVIVKASFVLREITEIDDQKETLQFTGVLRLSWMDTRQAFDPQKEGVDEKVFQGNYQFNELSPAWYPEVALVNASGMYEQYGIVLRVKPDGTNTLTSVIDAVAEIDLNMKRYPFDAQSLKAVFEIIGFNSNEVRFVSETPQTVQQWKGVKVSQWQIESINSIVDNSDALVVTRLEAPSTFNVIFELHRRSFFVVRLVMVPLILIVALSWSVFWMERSSLGDRISVSFVGILTAVAFQIVVGDLLPHISYYTLMNGFLNLSLFIMCATVVINLVVGAYDKRGMSDIGDLIDIRCRWIFPLLYFVILSTLTAIAFIFL